jgi:hypothetical protein
VHDPDRTFTETGKVTIQSGLDQDGDLAWRSNYEGMNPLEVVGALVIVGTRMVFKMVLPNMAREDEL